MIRLVPNVLDIFVPGILFIEGFLAFTSKRIRNFATKCLAYIVAGSIIKGICSFGHSFIFQSYYFSIYGQMFVACVVAVVFAAIAVALYKSRRINSFIAFTTHKDLRDDIFTGLIDFEQGTAMAITAHDGTLYIGSLYIIEENGEASWLALHSYFIRPTNGEPIDFTEYGEGSLLLIKKSDISRVCLLYDKDSPLAKEVRNVRER